MRTLGCLALLLLLSLTSAFAEEIRTGVFPFFDYAKRYDVWEFIPMDQGGRLVQLELIGSERDEDIIKAIRRPGFFAPWGNPIRWDSLEKTQPEKSVWLNRWYFLPCLARQYYLTGDKSYLVELMKFIRKWRDENPVPADLPAYFATRHENWRDMQVAWRMQNLAWGYFLGEKGFSAEEKRELYEMVKDHAHVLLAYFGDQPLIENNHQSHGASAMLHAALLFPDLPDAAALKARALEILSHHLDKAFYADGNSVELVPGYYPFFSSIFRDSYLLCRANHVTPPTRCEERLRQFYDFLGLVKQPDETMPPINDSTESSATVPLCALADVLKLPCPYPSAASHWFEASHQAVMRDAVSARPAYVFLDAGPQVFAHWHGGKLGFHLWFWDRPLLVDSGICNYDEPLRRAWYWNPEAHNTLLVDGKGDYYKVEESMKKRPFAGSKIVQWESNARYDWAVMRHEGFANRKEPVAWTRHFILLKGVAALVVDQLESAGEHDYTWLFHFAPCAAKVDEKTKTVFTGFAEKNLLLAPAMAESSIRLKVQDSNVNRRGVDVTAPVASYSLRGKSVTETFLLLPVPGGVPPETRVEQTVLSNGVEVRIVGKESARVRLTRDSGKYRLEVMEPPPGL